MANQMQRAIRHVENKRARKRLAKIRLANPNALPAVTLGPHGGFSANERQTILNAARAAKAKQAKPKAKPYNPLAPLSGKGFNHEVKAEANLQYNPQIKQAKQTISDEDKHTALVGSAYDQYKAALQQALTNTSAAYSAASADANTRLGTAYNQDTAAAQTAEGKQAAAAERGLSNSALTDLNTEAASANAAGNTNVASSVLGKTEALQRESDSHKKLESDLASLKSQKGNFKVSQRDKLRSDERTYALARKEFGLKASEFGEQKKVDKANIKAKSGTNNAQVLIAKLYANADRAKAKATIRVAKLQLDKGKIDQSQYRKIINVYRGLPAKGSSPNASGHPRFSNTQQAQVDHAVQQLEADKARLQDKTHYIEKGISNGLSRAQVNAAWRTYVKRNHLTNTTGGATPH